MDVVPLTLIISLCLVFTFIVFFLSEHARGKLSSAERDSLLPLAEEAPRLASIRPHPHVRGGGEDDARAPREAAEKRRA